EQQVGATDDDGVLVVQQGSLDPLPVDAGAVARVQILEFESAVHCMDTCVELRGRRIVDLNVGIPASPDRRAAFSHDVQTTCLGPLCDEEKRPWSNGVRLYLGQLIELLFE